MESKDSKLWPTTMKEEMTSLYKDHTWILVKRPKDQSVVGYKWIFKIKDRVTSTDSMKYKARLVAKSFTQK